MATDIFKLRAVDEPLPIEEQDIPSDAEGQWRIDFAAIHGRSPNQDDRDDWQWSLRFASQYGRGPSREDWERHFYDELGKRGRPTTPAQARREATPEFVARATSGVDRDRLGKLIVPFPWQADEQGAELGTDLAARFRQYEKWDALRNKYNRGSPEWNNLTTAMNQLQTSTAPWYFAFTPKLGLRDEVLRVAGNRSGQDRVQAVANWIRQKQAQGIDPFNDADPYTIAYKATAAQAQAQKAATNDGYRFTYKDPEIQAALQADMGLLGQDPELARQPLPNFTSAPGALTAPPTTAIPPEEPPTPYIPFTTPASRTGRSPAPTGPSPEELITGPLPGELAPRPETDSALAALLDLPPIQRAILAGMPNDAQLAAAVSRVTGQFFTAADAPQIRRFLTAETGDRVGGGQRTASFYRASPPPSLEERQSRVQQARAASARSGNEALTPPGLRRPGAQIDLTLSLTDPLSGLSRWYDFLQQLTGARPPVRR